MEVAYGTLQPAAAATAQLSSLLMAGKYRCLADSNMTPIQQTP
jgi:hypothetical protein